MKSYEESMLAVLADPEDDAVRGALAEAVRTFDPAWAELIELQLGLSANERARLPISTSFHEQNLLDENRMRWTRDLDFYVGELGQNAWIEFHRGLPWHSPMNPYTFLEHGEYICTRVAPLRGVRFFADPEGAPFPARELAASPLLRRLDKIAFHHDVLAPGQLETLLASPHLERARVWDLRDNPVTLETYEALAANELTRRALLVHSDFTVPSDRGPIGEVWGQFDIYPWRRYTVSAEGAALEKKYGYLPWLHIGNHCAGEDAHYWVEHKILPLYEPGSPADAPVRYGEGFEPEPALAPRAELEIEMFDRLVY